MIERARGLAGRWLSALLHIDDTPRRTAAAFALGVFCAFSPFLGLHTLMGLTLAFALRLNRVAVLLGVYSNLPWFLVPYYTFATMSGAVLLRAQLPSGFRARVAALVDLPAVEPDFWRQLVNLLQPFAWPFAVGSLIGALLFAVLAYPLALAFVTSERRLKHIIHKKHH
jgi:uncharacterized protein (DUF2062 family)